MGEMSKDYRKVKITLLHAFKKGKKGGLKEGKVSQPHLGPGESNESLVLETITTITRYMKGKKNTRNSPLTFKNWKSGLTNYCYEMTGLADGERTVDIVCLDFSKAFDDVLYKILIDKVFVYGLDGQRVR